MRFSAATLTLLMVLMSACDFGDTNIDPGLLRDVEARNILPAALAQSARNAGSIGARVTGTVIQHFNGISAQPEGYSLYALDENVIDDYWRSGLYGGAMKDCNIIIEKAATLNMPHYRGIAKVLMAYNLGIATSAWGDVPFSDAFQTTQNMKPRYDTQEKIYQSIQRLLDDALNDFGRLPGDFVPTGDDLVYGGNVAGWVATARALKARYYMHLTNVDALAHTKALTILSLGSISANDKQPDFKFDPSDESLNGANPLAYFAQDRTDQLQLGDFLVNLMTTRNDPRLTYYGVKSGNSYDIFDSSTNSKLFWTHNSAPLPLISYSEIKFIQAEAYLRLGDDAKAQAALATAITSNMTKLGLAATAYQTYVTTNSALTTLPLFENKLARILEQKYIAMYGHSTIESWVDYRRTGYPALTPPANVQLSYFSNQNPIIPRRYLYPQSERNANNASYLEAIERQGGHLLDTDVWAFKQH